MPKTTNFSLSQAGTIGSEYIPDWKRRKAFNEEGEKWKEEEKNKKKSKKTRGKTTKRKQIFIRVFL